jgi:hypothetical protein
MDKKEKLNDFEEEMLFGAIRYYMGRQTIVSATFKALLDIRRPEEIARMRGISLTKVFNG